MNIILSVKNNKDTQIKDYTFKISKNCIYKYFHRILKDLKNFKGIVFIKYFKEYAFKIACILEDYKIIIQGKITNN